MKFSPKSTFMFIFAILAALLVILPFVVTFNEFLTVLIVKIKIYRTFQDTLIPFLYRIIAAILSLFGFRTYIDPYYLYVEGMGKKVAVEIAWNCIGWQSLVLFLLTAVTGLQGEYQIQSKIQCLLLGILGTIFVNILRISLVALTAVFIGRYPAIIFHDYFSTLFVVVWLFVFWWLSYRYVLNPH